MDSVQSVSAKSQIETSRLRPAPEKLASVIQTVNSFKRRDGSAPASVDEIFDAFHAKQSDEVSDLIDEYKRQIDQLPQNLQQFIGPVRRETLPVVHERYSFLVAARNALQVLTQSRDINSEIQLEEPAQADFVRMGIDAEGKVVFHRTMLLEALDGIEANRLRRCEICRDFFWAGRKDQFRCTRECAHIARTRRWRDKYQVRYKPQRIAKEARKPRVTLTTVKSGRSTSICS